MLSLSSLVLIELFSLSPIVSIVLSTVMVFANASQTGYSMIVGTRIEGFVTILTVLSSVILAIVITRPVKGLAIDNDDSIAYGNQYYFSWIILFSSIVTPTVLYGSCCWTMTRCREKKLLAVQRRMLRMICHTGRKKHATG